MSEYKVDYFHAANLDLALWLFLSVYSILEGLLYLWCFTQLPHKGVLSGPE